MAKVSFVTSLHTSSKRNYEVRRLKPGKAKRMEIAKRFGKDYWDGDRDYGYGGYVYDGRWEKVARAMIDFYKLKDGDSVLDIGCGKGFLLYEFQKLLPNSKLSGIDISSYAIEHAKEEVKDFLICSDASKLPFSDKSFDLVVSNTTLHNLKIPNLFSALAEIERVGKKHKWICVESFRNENERSNLFDWQLTCECFYSPEEWEWIFKQTSYSGDYEFIYFE